MRHTSHGLKSALLVSILGAALAACGGGGGGGSSSSTPASSSSASSSAAASSISSSNSSATSSSSASSAAASSAAASSAAASSASSVASSSASSTSSAAASSASSASFVDQQVGFSTQNGGTTGGAGGDTVTVTTGTELNAALCTRASKTSPRIILVNGTINHGNTTKQSGQCDTQPDVIELKGVQNISIIGVGSNAVFDQIGIHLRDAKNIIIRNVHVKNVKKSGSPTSNGGDAIGMESDVSNVWVDHATLEASGGESDGYDALFDMKDGTKYVTLSWSHLKNSGRGGLVGSGDSDCANGPMTYHHNYYENLDSRTHLLRCVTAHVFNNYYNGLNESGINSRVGSLVKVENNYFTNAKNPLGTFYTSLTGYWEVAGNIFGSGVTWVVDVKNQEAPAGPNPVSTVTSPINIPYAYTLDDGNNVPSIVTSGAGFGKMGGSSGSSSASSAGSSASSSVASSSASSSAASSAASSASSSVTAPVCSAAFTCDSGVGAKLMSSTVTASGVSESLSAGVYTITGAGKMDNTNTYNFYFKHMPVTGDFVMTARILAQDGTVGSGTRAGLIAVEALTGSPVFAWTARYFDASGQIRAAINGNAKSAISGFSTSTMPVWVRIARSGNALTSAASTDGTSWTEKSNTTVSASTIYAGFAVSSGDDAAAAAASFDNFSITGGGITP